MSAIMLKDFKKLMGLSDQSVIKLKNALGLPKLSKLDTDMLPMFIAKKKELHMGRKQHQPRYVRAYQKSLEILEDQGYITKTNLTKVFGLGHVENALNYFDAQGDSLYEEEKLLPVLNKRLVNPVCVDKLVLIYKRVNPVFDAWREERLTVNGHYHAYHGHNGRIQVTR